MDPAPSVHQEESQSLEKKNPLDNQSLDISDHPVFQKPTSCSPELMVVNDKATADTTTPVTSAKGPKHPTIEIPTISSETFVDKQKVAADTMKQAFDTKDSVSGANYSEQPAIATPTSYSLDPSADKDKVTTASASSARWPVQPVIEKPNLHSPESSVDKATAETMTPAFGAKGTEQHAFEKQTTYSAKPTIEKDKATVDTVTQVCVPKDPEHPAIGMPTSYLPEPSAHENIATADTITPVSGAKGPNLPTIEKSNSYLREPSAHENIAIADTMIPVSGVKGPKHPTIEKPNSYLAEPLVNKGEVTDETMTPAYDAKEPEHPAIEKPTSYSFETSIDNEKATADTVTQVCGTKGSEHAAIENLSSYSSETSLDKDKPTADTRTPESSVENREQPVIRKRVPERMGENNEAKQPTGRSSLVDTKASINIHSAWNLALAIGGFIIVIVLIAFCLLRGSTESSGSSSSVLQIFHDEFKNLKADFPGQKDDLWLRSGKMLMNHLNKSEPLEPATFILTAAQDGENTLRCLSYRLASTYAIANNAKHLVVHGPSLAKLDAIRTKLQIDEELTAGFESTARAAVFYRLETLPPSSLLILYKYCDHENAAFKNVALVLTVLLDDKSLNTDMSLTELEEKVKDFLWERFISSDSIQSHHELDSDKLSGVWSRISHLVLPVLPVDSIEAVNCP